MKKTRFILGVIAAIAAAAMTGCQLELNNTEDRVSVGGYAVKSIEISGGTKSFVIGTAFTKGDLKVMAHSYDPAEAEAGVEVTDYTVSIADSIAEGTKFDKLGTKEVVVTYKGCTAEYSVEITNAVESITVDASAAKTTFYALKGEVFGFESNGLIVTATYSDNTSKEISDYKIDISALNSVTASGKYAVTIKYSDTITTSYYVDVTVVTDAGWTGSATTSVFWQDMGGTADAKVEAGSVVSSKFTVNSATTINWCQLPCVVLRSEDGDGAGTEYAVVRGDNYGWKGEVKTSEALATLGWELSSDWNWEEFCSWTNGATCTVSVINWGNGTAEVRYDLEKDGTTHFQYYKNIKVDADVFFRLKGDAGTSITFAE